MKNIDENFKNIVIDFIYELNNKCGFNISNDRILKIFKIYGSYDFFDEDESKNVLMNLLCTNLEQQAVFKKCFSTYFKQSKQIASDSLNELLHEDKLNEIQQIKEDFETDKIIQSCDMANKISNIEKVNENIINNIKEIILNINILSDEITLFNILIHDGSTIYSICKLTNERQYLIKNIEQDTQEAMMYAINNNYDEETINAIIESAELLSKSIEEFDDLKTEHLIKDIQISNEIKKIESKNHREIYIEGQNSVQTTNGYLFKDFRKLDDNDLKKISGFIKRNILQIKTKILKSQNIKKSDKLNYKKVMKLAAKTDMIPIELFYKDRKKKRTKIICITDISGSCKNATQILMTLIYALQEAFPGGVESYVFVKELSDATDIFRNYSLKEANERASILVERDYSDYFTAFKQFDEKYFSTITKDSIIIYLGDARNNKNDDGIEYLKKIRIKIKSGRGNMFWLNPDDIKKWDTGDSVISKYAKYMDKTFNIKNTSDILKFLEVLTNTQKS